LAARRSIDPFAVPGTAAWAPARVRDVGKALRSAKRRAGALPCAAADQIAHYPMEIIQNEIAWHDSKAQSSAALWQLEAPRHLLKVQQESTHGGRKARRRGAAWARATGYACPHTAWSAVSLCGPCRVLEKLDGPPP
jgi:hypothetical protein